VRADIAKRIFVSKTRMNGKTLSCSKECSVVSVPIMAHGDFETIEHLVEDVWVCEGFRLECFVDIRLGFEEAEDLLSEIIEASVLGDDASLYARGPLYSELVGRADAD
tara:strand:- start:7165 stop:7488 length:324 start_codon:yes stop_codon:yes gene_type:complete